MPESSGIDTLAGASRVVENGIVLGNTQWVADRIVELTGATQFAMKTEQDYPGSHKALVEQGTIEKRTNARPELKKHISNLDDYDVIFIGYPIWWAELPMPLYSFLEEYDFSGKRIIPFSTHGGSQLAGTIDTFKEKLPNSEVVENAFTVSRDHVRESKASIADWLDELWGTMPMAVFSFLESVDLSGKAILPFCTHEGSGLGHSIQDLKSFVGSAEIKEGLAVRGSQVDRAQQAVSRWLRNLEY